jgi:uncharacterized protein YpbB
VDEYRMTDKLRNFGTIFDSRDYYNINMAIHKKEAMDNMATPKVHQRGGDV